MQLHLPEPAYAGSTRARANFRLALRLALGFVVLLWVVYLLDRALALELARFGVRPRELQGLVGVLLAPLLHGGWRHLLDNSLALLLLVPLLLFLYPHSALKATPAIYLGSGLAVWLLGRPAVHLGASGLVYGFAAYVFVAGLVRRDVCAVAAAMAVFFLYGTLVWGVLPLESGTSWETHLAAALLGGLTALHYRRLDAALRKRYDWEDDDEDDDGGGEPWRDA